MYCENCGTPLKDSDRFCPKCGQPVKRNTLQKQNIPLQKQPDRPKHNRGSSVSIVHDRRKTVLIVLAVLVIAVLAFFLFQMNSDTGESKSQSVLSTQTEESEKTVDKKQSGNATTQDKDSSTTSQSDSSKAGESSTITKGTHTYKFLSGDVSFEEAAQKARQLGGYLASIDSEQEFNTIVNLARSQHDNGSNIVQYYIGARRDPGQSSYYFTDESGNLTNTNVDTVFGSWFWGEDEPSYTDVNSGDEETILSLMYLSSSDQWVGNDVVDDIATHFSEFSGRVGYIIEIEN